MFGEEAHHIAAREAFPILIELAKACDTIKYSILADKLDIPAYGYPMAQMLGSIVTTLAQLGKQWNEELPHLTALVVRSDTGYPSYPSGTPNEVFDAEFERIYKYPKWGTVQHALLPDARDADYESGQIVKADSQDIHSEVVKPGEELPNNTQQAVNNSPMNNENKKYFIGHGGSPEWLKLRDFLEKTLKLPYEEFNRIPQAGKITSIRLKEMLESCCMAFLIMTGEDEHTDGTRHARGNVIHEIGLFQAQLGYEKAIILLEEGCEIFSNIQGITYIPFPKGNIKAAFEDIRQVLERESIM